MSGCSYSVCLFCKTEPECDREDSEPLRVFLVYFCSEYCIHWLAKVAASHVLLNLAYVISSRVDSSDRDVTVLYDICG